jgi:hypothetical protein
MRRIGVLGSLADIAGKGESAPVVQAQTGFA